jgi:hypothetical protein
VVVHHPVEEVFLLRRGCGGEDVIEISRERGDQVAVEDLEVAVPHARRLVEQSAEGRVLGAVSGQGRVHLAG